MSKQASKSGKRDTKTVSPRKRKKAGVWKPSPLPLWPQTYVQTLQGHIKRLNADYFTRKPHISPSEGFPANVGDIIKFMETKEREYKKKVRTRKELDEMDFEFGWSFDFDPYFLSRLIYEGFLSICSELQENVWFLLPKLHSYRCIIDLSITESPPKSTMPSPQQLELFDTLRKIQAGQTAQQELTISQTEAKLAAMTGGLYISKNNRKRSSKYSLTVDRAFIDVCKAVLRQHGPSWLHPPMQALLLFIHNNAKSSEALKRLNGVRIHSVELWDDKTGHLVAGELGSTVGGIYTSLTGFYHTKYSGCGMVQMGALGKLLQHCGFKLWDLGMFMSYKATIGAIRLPRLKFVVEYRKLRDLDDVVLLQRNKINAKELLDKELPKAPVRAEPAMDEIKMDVDDADVETEEAAMRETAQQQKPMSKKQQKRLARLEKRKLAKQKKKLEKTATATATTTTKAEEP